MIIFLKKFGKVLTSRSAGREAFMAIRPNLDLNAKIIEIDFSEIISLGPGWADEFFTALKNMYQERLKYLPSDNMSVIETLKILGETLNNK